MLSGEGRAAHGFRGRRMGSMVHRASKANSRSAADDVDLCKTLEKIPMAMPVRADWFRDGARSLAFSMRRYGNDESDVEGARLYGTTMCGAVAKPPVDMSIVGPEKAGLSDM